jgi:hypothetical protein
VSAGVVAAAVSATGRLVAVGQAAA